MIKNVLESTYVVTLYLTVALTVVSQMPGIHGDSLFSSVYTFLWMLVFFLGLCFFRINYINSYFLKLFAFLLIWFISVGCGIIAFDKNYFSNETTTLFLSIFVAINGYLSGEILKGNRLEKLMYIYIISTIMNTIVVYNTYYVGFNFTWDNNMKNSFSPILLVNIILLVFYDWKGWLKSHRYIRYLVSLLFMGMILLIRSRATIFCLLFIGCICLFKRIDKMRNRLLVISSFIVILCIVLSNDILNNLIINKILLTERDSFELNSLSSGRINDIVNYFEDFTNNIFFGIGSMYIDCFYILSIYQYGLIGGISVIMIAMIPTWFVLKNVNKVPYYYTIMVLSFSVNGLFEGLTPIGPGVKCMLMWLLFGIYNKTIKV